MSNVKNFPDVDKRMIEFAADLEDFIRERGKDLPLISIVGSIETVKHVLIAECLVEINDKHQ